MSIIPNLPTPQPVDYSSRDFNSVLTDLISQIPNYLPEWIDRSPSDFGIALLELFAYQADLLSYYIDRVANEAFLSTAQQRQSILNLANLLDYTPTGAVAATVSLLFTINNPSPLPVIIPAGTLVTTAAVQGSSVTFQTNTKLTIWGDNGSSTVQNALGTGQANQQILLTGSYDGGSGLVVTVGGVTWTRSPDDLFTGHSYTGSSTVYIVVNKNVVQFGNNTLGIEPGNGAAIVLTYSPVGVAPAPQYSASVLATQGIQVNSEILGTSNGGAGQIFTIFGSPVVGNSVKVSVDEGSGPTPWINFDKLIDASPIDLAYSTNTTAVGVIQVIFGDGVNGRAPINGAIITVNYQVGGGVVGNVPANSLTILSQTIQGVVSVTNAQPAFGGSDIESLDHIRLHAPLSLSAANRAVTANDYASLVGDMPTVSKASSVALSLTVVAIYIHPLGGFFTDLTALAAAVTNLATTITNPSNLLSPGFLDDKKMAFVSVQVIPPKYHNGGSTTTGYVPVDITISPLVVLPQYNQNSVQQAVLAAVNGLLSFSSVNFGSRLTLSQVYQTFQGIPGVAYGTVTVMARHEAGAIVGDIVCAVDEIPAANVIIVNATGGLT